MLVLRKDPTTLMGFERLQLRAVAKEHSTQWGTEFLRLGALKGGEWLEPWMARVMEQGIRWGRPLAGQREQKSLMGYLMPLSKAVVKEQENQWGTELSLELQLVDSKGLK